MPTGKLPVSLPKDQGAMEQNASDFPGWAEPFDRTHTNAVGDEYGFGLGLGYVD